eukprot:CAMPEP_0176423244 /NCGR_PEP_ID=MMETSP0127-20121128/10172_1 /TAXON_ID=938130 /ORGANISM="Platyophrya macrostoma, Strain WH" /LENGTH=176 /DNA_ID=CAMNT_0017804165 /DNA_START=67 /DNA_END=592 /DNA_ORIENTATION=-
MHPNSNAAQQSSSECPKERELYDALQAWVPKPIKSGTSRLQDRIRCAPNPRALFALWEEYLLTLPKQPLDASAAVLLQPNPISGGKSGASWRRLKSFVKAAADWGRRCPSVAEPLLFELAQQSGLDLSDYTTLAVTTCDVHSRRLVDMLLKRTSGTVQYVAFYYALIRCCCEFLRP